MFEQQDVSLAALRGPTRAFGSNWQLWVGPEHRPRTSSPEHGDFNDPALPPLPAPAASRRTELSIVTDETTPAFGLILCGAGESGKTTFTRELKLNFLPHGISDEDRSSFIPTIRGNVIKTMQCLLEWLEQNQRELPDDLSECASLISATAAFSAAFTSEFVDALWSDPIVADAFGHKDDTIIPDHMDYFFTKLDAFVDDEYVPTDDDILRAWIRTVGVKSVTFSALVRIYDVFRRLRQADVRGAPEQGRKDRRRNRHICRGRPQPQVRRSTDLLHRKQVRHVHREGHKD
jgi:hypothetical protein